MKNLHLVYDFANQSPAYGFILAPLFVLAGGILYYFKHKKYVDRNATTMIVVNTVNKRKSGMVFGIVIASLGGLFSLLFITSILRDYFKTKKIYDNRQYQTVEGKVENYRPDVKTERFDVNEVHFEFSDAHVINNYNNEASNGGAIRQGLYVRIGYINNGNENIILRLETE